MLWAWLSFMCVCVLDLFICTKKITKKLYGCPKNYKKIIWMSKKLQKNYMDAQKTTKNIRGHGSHYVRCFEL